MTLRHLKAHDGSSALAGLDELEGRMTEYRKIFARFQQQMSSAVPPGCCAPSACSLPGCAPPACALPGARAGGSSVSNRGAAAAAAASSARASASTPSRAAAAIELRSSVARSRHAPPHTAHPPR